MDRIIGQECVKRAVEVALSGNHSILLLGGSGSGKTLWIDTIRDMLPAQVVSNYSEWTKVEDKEGLYFAIDDLVDNGANKILNLISKTPLIASIDLCQCGNYNHPIHMCQCSPEDVIGYRYQIKRSTLDRFDISIELTYPGAELLFYKGNEKTEDILKRIGKINTVKSGIKKTYPEVDEDSQKLIMAAYKQLGLSIGSCKAIISIANTIALMSGSDKIRVEHTAEALQYKSVNYHLM